MPNFLSSLANPYQQYVGFQNPTTKKGLAFDVGTTLNENKALEQQQQNNRNAESSSLFPGYQSMLDSGYSNAEKSSIVGGALTPIAGAYGSARGEAGRHVARTRNSAGYGSTLSDLARGQSQDMANASSNTQVKFADEKQRRKEAGLKGISELYGVDTSFLNALGGQQLDLMGVGNSVQSRSRGVLGSLAAGAEVAKSFVGKGEKGGLFS